MSKINDIANVLPDPHTYDVIINDFQRAMLMKVINHAIHTMPNGMWRPDEKAVAESVYDLLDPNGSVGPLCPKGLTSFVL